MQPQLFRCYWGTRYGYTEAEYLGEHVQAPEGYNRQPNNAGNGNSANAGYQNEFQFNWFFLNGRYVYTKYYIDSLEEVDCFTGGGGRSRKRSRTRHSLKKMKMRSKNHKRSFRRKSRKSHVKNNM